MTLHVSSHFRKSLSTAVVVMNILACLGFSVVRAEVVDRVVAVVNNEAITLSELNTEAEGIIKKIQESSAPGDKERAIQAAKNEILDTMIDKRLIAQKAKSAKISVTEEEIDTALTQILKRTNQSKEELLKNLESTGMSEPMYQATLKSQILQNKLISNDSRAKVVITDEMARQYYDKSKPSSSSTSVKKESAYYTLQQIGCNWRTQDGSSDPASVSSEEKATARARIESVYKKAKDGSNFNELAVQYSDLPSAADKGNLGSFEASELAESTLKVIAPLKQNEISEIIETPTGYQFFKLVKKQEGKEGKVAEAAANKDDFEKVKDSIKQELYNQEMKKAFEEWAKDLKNQAYIQKL